MGKKKQLHVNVYYVSYVLLRLLMVQFIILSNDKHKVLLIK